MSVSSTARYPKGLIVVSVSGGWSARHRGREDTDKGASRSQRTGGIVYGHYGPVSRKIADLVYHHCRQAVVYEQGEYSF